MIGLPLVYHPVYSIELPPGHPFPMQKFRLLHRYLIEQGIASESQIHQPQRAGRELLQLAHCEQYLQRFTDGTEPQRAMRRTGIPWSPKLVERSETAVAGTVLTAELALQHGIACHLAGGTHHAHADYGAGYCLLNDLAVAALYVLEQGLAQRVLILDCDVHQGDGTARILADNPSVFTCSIHAARNYPARKADSDLDIALPDGIADDDYIEVLETHVPGLLDRFAPELLLYDAGVDVHQHDRLGHMQLTDTGLARRDRFVLEAAIHRGIPVAGVIGGGYDKDVRKLAARHAILHQQASHCFSLL